MVRPDGNLSIDHESDINYDDHNFDQEMERRSFESESSLMKDIKLLRSVVHEALAHTSRLQSRLEPRHPRSADTDEIDQRRNKDKAFKWNEDEEGALRKDCKSPKLSKPPRSPPMKDRYNEDYSAQENVDGCPKFGRIYQKGRVKY